MIAAVIAAQLMLAAFAGVGGWTVGGWIGSAIRQRQRRSLARWVDAVIARHAAEKQKHVSWQYSPGAFTEPIERSTDRAAP